MQPQFLRVKTWDTEAGLGSGLACGGEGHTGATSHGRCRPLRIETVEEARQKNRRQCVHAGSGVCAHACAPAPVCVTTVLDTW